MFEVEVARLLDQALQFDSAPPSVCSSRRATSAALMALRFLPARLLLWFG